MQHNQSLSNTIGTKELIGLMALAYLFSFAIRMIWVYQFHGNPNFIWNDQLMINTNDGYFFASGAQQALFGMHESNPRIPDIFSFGAVFFTSLLAKITPFSLETITLYMPAVVSSLVVIPIILIARLYGKTLWGFFAALLGSIAWSYYNRTMVGYYDTDMFSAMAPMFILFFLMKSTIDFNLRSALYASLAIAVYPFLYDQGRAVVYAMGLIYAAYMVFYHRQDDTTYRSLILLFIALVPFPMAAPLSYIVKAVVLIGGYFALQKVEVEQKKLMLLSGVLFLIFMIFGNVFGLIFTKISGYLASGTKESGLHFYGVVQTVREAGKIPFEVFANRISGSQVGVVLSLIGYIALVVRHRAFLLALPLVGIGIFALWGGLRFTVYAVPVAAMSAVFLFWFTAETFTKEKVVQIGVVTLATAALIYPNITHIIEYKVPTVLNKQEVEDLAKLKSISSEKDYTIAWWDYGYPIWYYSETNTIIDGGKHQNDNFIVSTVLQTSSAELAANFSRLAVETYVGSNYRKIADTIFKNKREDQVDPNLVLDELRAGTYTLPQKTREVYLYMPFRMLNIFPTVMLFGNLDLTTGKPIRESVFYITGAVGKERGIIKFGNGIQFDTQKGTMTRGQTTMPVKRFFVAQTTPVGQTTYQTQLYHAEGNYSLIYMRSYNRFIILDNKTLDSMYVQMFILGNYDKSLFELVVSSPYSKIYRLKK